MLGVPKHFQLTAGRAVFLKVSFISSFSDVVEFHGGSPAAPEAVVSCKKVFQNT